MTVIDIDRKFIKYCNTVKRCIDCRYYDEVKLRCELLFAYDLGRKETETEKNICVKEVEE